MTQQGRQGAILGRLAAVAAAVAFAAGCADSEMDRADKLMAEKKYAQAIEVWKASLEDRPSDRTTITRIATAQARMGRLDKAQATLEHALERAPDDVVLRHNLGLVHLKAKDFDAALDQFHTILDLQDAHPNAHYYIGLIHEMRGDETTARRYYVQEVNKGSSVHAWDRLLALNEKRERPQPNRRAIWVFSIVLLGVAVVAFGLRIVLDRRRNRELSLYGVD
ncbi:MAG: tetratricopeptide repeat protein [Planctomycetota bacterium]